MPNIHKRIFLFEMGFETFISFSWSFLVGPKQTVQPPAWIHGDEDIEGRLHDLMLHSTCFGRYVVTSKLLATFVMGKPLHLQPIFKGFLSNSLGTFPESSLTHPKKTDGAHSQVSLLCTASSPSLLPQSCFSAFGAFRTPENKHPFSQALIRKPFFIVNPIISCYVGSGSKQSASLQTPAQPFHCSFQASSRSGVFPPPSSTPKGSLVKVRQHS